MKRVVALLLIGACMPSAITAHAQQENWKQQFQKASVQILRSGVLSLFSFCGNSGGYHQYDSKLED